jgi:hypothetical protein
MSNPQLVDIPSGRWGKLVFYTLGFFHDFAYFGYVTVQPLIFNLVLQSLPPFKEYSFEITVFIISTQLFWQVLLETPTGAYADKRGRMHAVREHFLIRVGCMALLLGAVFLSTSSDHSYVPWLVLACFLLIEFGMAAAEALLSGSLDAWLVDTLCASGTKDETAETFSKGATLFNIAILLSMPLFLFLKSGIASLGAYGGIYLVTTVAAVVFAIGALVAHVSRREVYRIGNEWTSRSKATIKATWRDGLRYLWEDRMVWWTTVLKASPFATWVVISWFWPLLVKYPQTGLDSMEAERWAIGFAIALAISRVMGSGFSYLVQKLTSPLQGLLHWTGITLAAALVAGFSLLYLDRSLLDTLALPGTASRSSLVLFAYTFGFSIMIAKASEEVVKVFNQIFLANYVQRDTVRATVISFTGAVMNLIGFILINLGLVIIWWQSPQNKPPSLLIFASCSGITLAIIAYSMLRRSMVRASTLEAFDPGVPET